MTFSVYSIGFTKTTAKKFFDRIRGAGIKEVIDVRIHNTSQLAGFAKAVDLAYFLNEIGSIAYRHLPLLAPEEEMLSRYRSGAVTWPEYERRFLDLMSRRRIEERLSPETLADTCLLCSEDTPHKCHRRLVLEYLNEHWDTKVLIKHL